MPIRLEASIVRIFATKGGVVGTGFLIGEMTVLTCAHVVATALGISGEASAAPEMSVSLDFPLVAPGCQLSAQIIFWQPIHANGGGDIAVLHLDNASPNGANITRLVVAEDMWDHPFRVFGFPVNYDQGVWASGRLRAREATGWMQIEDVKTTGKSIQRGFSGGAVWDEHLEGVAGMVVAADEDASKVAYMIPANALIKAWPALGQQAIPPCPYRGLLAFREQDEAYFFGRAMLTQQLVDAVRRKPLYAVVGPSGSGKSSVVFAGLVPRLRREGNWLIMSFRPGSRPFRSLAAALIPLLEPQMSETDRLTEIGKLARRFQQGDIVLQDVIESIAQKSSSTHLLLIADQFEELYTLCREPTICQPFLDELLSAAQALNQQGLLSFHLVLTLRADFVGQALSYRTFADALQDADLKIGPMNRTELQDVIRRPAQNLGVQIEGGLTERILDEVGREIGHLPLLEFALTLLWSKQQNATLTHTAYEEIGGVEKALSDHAEEVYAELNEEQQPRAQQVFVQLVRPGEGTQDTRRLATRAEVGEDNWELVVRLSNERLVVSGQDQTTGEETVEVVHEALIQGWQRLHAWMDSNREFRAWQERLRAALRQWESSGRDSGGLLRGTPLVEATTWMKQRAEAIGPSEQTFIEASRQHQEEEAQRWQTLYEEATKQRQEAERRRKIAIAQALAFQALRQQERSRQDELGALLARQAYLFNLRSQGSSLDLIDDSLRSVLSTPYFSVILPGNIAAFSPSSTTLATEYDGTVQLWDLRQPSTPPTILKIPKSESRLFGPFRSLVFSRDGARLAGCSGDGSLWLWDLNRPDIDPAHLDGPETTSWSLAFSPDGTRLASSSDGVWLWDPSRPGTAPVILRSHASSIVRAIAFNPDGTTLATNGFDNSEEVWLWNLHRPEDQPTVLRGHQARILSVAFSPDGTMLASGSTDGTVRLWDLRQSSLVFPFVELAHGVEVRSVAFSPDGTMLASGSDDGSVRLWNVRLPDATLKGEQHISIDFSLKVLLNYQPRIREQHTSVAFSPDSIMLASGSAGGAVRLWDLRLPKATPRVLEAAGGFGRGAFFPVAVSPDGTMRASCSSDWTVWLQDLRRPDAAPVALSNFEADHRPWIQFLAFSQDGTKLVAVGIGDTTMQLWDLGQASQLPIVLSGHEQLVTSVAFSPDGYTLASGSDDRTVRLWDLRQPERSAVALNRHEKKITSVAFSPDGYTLASGSDDRTVRLWDLRQPDQLPIILSGPEQAAGHEERVTSVAFSPNGHILASSYSDSKNSYGTVCLWDLYQPGINPRVFHIYGSAVPSIAFSPDGKTMALGVADGTVQLRDTGQLSTAPIVLSGHRRAVLSVAFSSDGQLVVSMSSDEARVWIALTESLADMVCEKVWHNLSQDEWNRFIGSDLPYECTCSNLPPGTGALTNALAASQ